MGRLVNRSNPTEVDGAWAPAGAGAPTSSGGGWAFSSQQYDWNGRPTVSTNADGSAGQVIAYGGCGCAGEAVVTVTDAVGRGQKSYGDAPGRVIKARC